MIIERSISLLFGSEVSLVIWVVPPHYREFHWARKVHRTDSFGRFGESRTKIFA
jgi:hypothetical protein